MCYYLNVHFQGQKVKPESLWPVPVPPDLTFRHSALCPRTACVVCVDLRTYSDYIAIQN